MTRREVYNYFIKKHKCDQFLPNEYGKANCIGIRNPQTRLEIFFDTPIDDSRMKDFTIGQLSAQLGLEPPPGLEHVKGIVDAIAKTDFSEFPPKNKNEDKPSLN